MREIFKFIFKIITIIIYRPKIIGAENVPKEGNAIICANHVHFWDSVVIIVMLKRKVNVLAKEELFKPKFNKWFAGVIGAYPVKRGTADLGAVKTSLKLMENKELLLVFPEGTRNGVAKGKKAKKGSVMIAATSESPIIPIGVQGTFKPFTKVTLNIGKPIDYSAYKNETKDKAKMDELAQELMTEIIKLRDEKKERKA
jgi:1-acyl-sn-glycerol-3-phosphate acyltransferase